MTAGNKAAQSNAPSPAVCIIHYRWLRSIHTTSHDQLSHCTFLVGLTQQHPRSSVQFVSSPSNSPCLLSCSGTQSRVVRRHDSIRQGHRGPTTAWYALSLKELPREAETPYRPNIALYAAAWVRRPAVGAVEFHNMHPDRRLHHERWLEKLS